MSESRLKELLRELRRRRVYRVAALYVVATWGLLQGLDTLGPAVGLDDAPIRLLVPLAVAGFPVVLVLGWIFDLTISDGGGGSDEAGGPGAGLRRVALLGGTLVASIFLGYGVWTFWPDQVLSSEASVPTDPSTSGPLSPSRVAVLYLDDTSPDESLGYMAAGLTEGLIHELAQIEPLEVVSRSGVKPYRDAPAAMADIARELEAGSIVEGSVARSEGRLRVTVQLIDGETDTHLMSQVFERDEGELFALQDEILAEVTSALRVQLGETIERRQVQERTGSVEAWTRFQRGEEALDDYDAVWRSDADAARRLLLRADSLFARAAISDPEWSLPVSRRARVARVMASRHGPDAGVLDPGPGRQAVALADAALARDPGSVEARVERGYARLLLSSGPGDADRDLRAAAGEDLEEAVRLDPDHAPGWAYLSEWLIVEGRTAEAVVAADRAIQADAFLQLPTRVLDTYWYATLQEGPTDRARAACDRAYRQFPGRYPFVQCQMYLLASFPQVPPNVPRAWRLLDSLAAASDEARVGDALGNGLIQVAKVLVRAGLPDSALAVSARAWDHAPAEMLVYDEAHLNVLLGRPDSAIDRLHSHLAFFPADTVFVVEDWWFEPLHDAPGWTAISGER